MRRRTLSDRLRPNAVCCRSADHPGITHRYRKGEDTLALMTVIDAVFMDCPWYGSRQMTRHLKRHGQAVGRHRVRRLMADLMLRSALSQAEWAKITQSICEICEIEIGGEAIAEYLAYVDQVPELQDEAVLPGNMYPSASGVPIEVSTIHGVKGETHDATLVLETKFRTLFDVNEMLPFLIDPSRVRPVFDPSHPNTHASIRASFMKKMYVATTRARQLVCIAMHRDRISQQDMATLRDEEGWAFIDI